MEQASLVENYNYAAPWDQTVNRSITESPLSIAKCPSATQSLKAGCDYAPCVEITRNNPRGIIVPILIPAGIPDRSNWEGAFRPSELPQKTDPHPFEKGLSSRDFTDGLSGTILFIEDAGRPEVYEDGVLQAKTTKNLCTWPDPNMYFRINDYCGRLWNCNSNNEIYSFHPDGCNYLMADGSVHFFADEMSLNVFCSLFTRAGGDPIDATNP